MLRSTLALSALLALACGRGTPKYSEEILGREEYVAPTAEDRKSVV